MKKIIAGQIILLLLTIGLGIFLKSNLESEIRIFHKLFGLLSVLTGVIVVVFAFIQRLPSAVKILSISSFLLTLFAGIGGILTQSGNNYQAAFYQMAFSATFALILSIINFFKTKEIA